MGPLKCKKHLSLQDLLYPSQGSISGLQTLHEFHSEVAFDLELRHFLSCINDSFGKLLSLFQPVNRAHAQLSSEEEDGGVIGL